MITGITASTRRFGIEGILYRKDNGVTIAVKEGVAPFTGWTVFEGADYLVVEDRTTLLDIVDSFKDLEGNGEIITVISGKELSLDRVVTTFVTEMRNVFSGAATFNQDISSWDVSNVTDMASMFASAASFNRDIGSWDVSSVTYMGTMFNSASSFNQDLSSWCVPLITSKPSYFDNFTSKWVKEDRQPVWGTCPARP